MSNDFYSEQHLYNDLGFADDLKALKSPMEDNFNQTYEMDDGLYTGGLGAAPLLYDNSPLMGSTASPNLEPFKEEFEVFQSTNLTQELTDFANSILTHGDSYPLEDESRFDFDYGIANEIDEREFAESPFPGSDYDSSSLMGATALAPAPSVDPTKPRKRTSRKAAEKARIFLEEQTSVASNNYEPMYPDPAYLVGAPSPASSTTSSCGFDSLSEDASKKPRQRRPRVSYNTLTEEEKYKRIRDLNNEASRNYRERQKTHLSDLEQQIPELEERNRKLKNKQVGLEKLLAQMKLCHQNLFKEPVNNGEISFNQF